MSATVIQFDKQTCTIRSGERVIAMQAKYPCGDQEPFACWAHNIELGGNLSVAVANAIMTSPANISGPELAAKINSLLN